MAHYWSILLATVDGLTLTPSLMVIPANFQTIFTSPESRMIVLPVSENRMIVSSFVSTKHWNVTEGRIDRQTWHGMANTAVRIADVL